MENTYYIKKRVIKWFGSIPVELMQKANTEVSTLLREMQGLKTTQGNQCRFSPCGKHQYSRGLCARHYALVNRIKRLTNEDYNTFVKIGICLSSRSQLRLAVDDVKEPRSNDPLSILIRKSYT